MLVFSLFVFFLSRASKKERKKEKKHHRFLFTLSLSKQKTPNPVFTPPTPTPPLANHVGLGDGRFVAFFRRVFFFFSRARKEKKTRHRDLSMGKHAFFFLRFSFSHRFLSRSLSPSLLSFTKQTTDSSTRTRTSSPRTPTSKTTTTTPKVRERKE